MGILLDFENGVTSCTCDRCKSGFVVDNLSGRVPDGWGTGQLWLDVSLSEIRQVPLCFCADCFAIITGGNVNTLQVKEGV